MYIHIDRYIYRESVDFCPKKEKNIYTDRRCVLWIRVTSYLAFRVSDRARMRGERARGGPPVGFHEIGYIPEPDRIHIYVCGYFKPDDLSSAMTLCTVNHDINDRPIRDSATSSHLRRMPKRSACLRDRANKVSRERTDTTGDTAIAVSASVVTMLIVKYLWIHVDLCVYL